MEPSSDQSSPVTITPYPDGPYLVRGEFVVQDQAGNELPLQRRTIALCRCGKSRMRPLCDGTHGDTRMYFQSATSDKFREIIERVTGRKVRAFISGLDAGVDVCAEIFYLEGRD